MTRREERKILELCDALEAITNIYDYDLCGLFYTAFQKICRVRDANIKGLAKLMKGAGAVVSKAENALCGIDFLKQELNDFISDSMNEDLCPRCNKRKIGSTGVYCKKCADNVGE